MVSRLLVVRGKYPRQFWLMFWGMLISTVGSSMVWPFLMIYVTERLDLPLATAASLTTINAATGLAAAFFAGPVADRVGRKWILVVSLLGLGVVYLLYTQANALWIAALLMAGNGLFTPLYRVGGDAMMADLIPAEGRADAYALLRMSNNVGISIGPAVGGFLAATSYNYAFLAAAVGFTAYAVLLAVFARETLPGKQREANGRSVGDGDRLGNDPHNAHSYVNRESHPGDERQGDERQSAHSQESGQGERSAPGPRIAGGPQLADRKPVERRPRFGGYGQVFRDRPFVYFIIAFTMTQLCATLIWVLLGVHAKTHYGVLENQYGLIPMTNAVMVVLLQAVVTHQTKKHAPLPVLALGTLFYAAACTGVAFAQGFAGFWASMVVMTIGELMLMPTSTTYTANLAPADMRGRYMSIYSLTWNVAYGIGPVMGGYLSDNVSPSATWYGGGIIGAVAVIAFLLLAARERQREQAATA